MGAVAASIYLLILIAFIPFPFYKDIVAATSGGGNRDVVLQVAEVETGRFLHRFPHSKVRICAGLCDSGCQLILTTCPALRILIRPPHSSYNNAARHHGRHPRPAMASQSADPCARLLTSTPCILC